MKVQNLIKTNSNGDFNTSIIFGEETKIKSIDFLDSLNGWCFTSDVDFSWGPYGNIWKTSDAGKNWELLVTYNSGIVVNRIRFMNKNEGYFVGYDGTIAYSNDGGYSWNLQWHTYGDNFLNFYFVDTKNGWVVGDHGVILHTTNGGNIWNNQISGTTEQLNSVYFANNETGWIAGNSGSVFKTTDGGENWFLQTTSSVQLNSVHGIDNDVVYTVGNNGVILKTSDGGINWETIESGTSNNLNRIEFSDLNSGWVVGDLGTILFTSNRGTTWFTQNSGTVENLISINYSEGKCWVGGEHSTLLIYNNSPVPVELISFNSKLDANRVFLRWETASETNNSGFNIERKIENAEWQSLGFVKGKGTTTERNLYSFTDDVKDVRAEKIYYRLVQTDFNGIFEYSNILQVNLKSIPAQFTLNQNYPNPFNPSTIIEYQISQDGFISLIVYDVLGNEVKTLVNEPQTTGAYSVKFDASDLASGIYVYQIQMNNFVSTKKMMLLK